MQEDRRSAEDNDGDECYKIDEHGVPVIDGLGAFKTKRLTALSISTRWVSKHERWVVVPAEGPVTLTPQDLATMFQDEKEAVNSSNQPTAAFTGAVGTE